MIRIYLAMVDIVPAAVVLIPIFLILLCTIYQRNIRKSSFYCLFCLYLSAVFSLVGIPNILYFRPDLNGNIIPFYGILLDLKNSLLNIALFVPLGCFLPVLWARFRKLASVVFFGLGLSVMIEALQMLTYRATDVNDLITNVMGTAVGFLLAKRFARKYPMIEERSMDPYFLVGLSFSVMFFVHPILSPFIWDRIL